MSSCSYTPENFVLSLEYRLEKHRVELFMKTMGGKIQMTMI